MNIIWGDRSERLFEDTYRKLATYHEKHGHLPPSNTRLNDKDLRILIGRMIKLRQSYRMGNLNDEQIRRLQDLNFPFAPDEERWQGRFREFERYVTEGGDSNNVPSSHPLRSWVRGVRYSHKHGTLSNEKIEMLEKLGMTWENPKIKREKIKNNQWEANYRIVEKYFKKNASICCVPDGNILPTSHPCYNWWKSQILYFYALPADRTAKIRSLKPAKLGGRWSKAEKEIVRSNPDKTAEAVADMLIGRSPEAVQKLRLKFEWGNDTRAQKNLPES
jgi:hypothetical protein